MCVSNLSGVLGDMFRFVYSRICCGLCNRKDKKHATSKNDSFSAPENQKTKIVDNEENMNADNAEEKVSVPLTVTMLIITAYIIFGAFLFNMNEGWALITAAYFCFITLTTIGKQKI